jgi:hypothetical protein
LSPSRGGGNELLEGFGDRKTICACRSVSNGSSPTSSPHPPPRCRCPRRRTPQAQWSNAGWVQRLEMREAGAEFMLIQFIFTSTLRIVPSKRNGRRSK